MARGKHEARMTAAEKRKRVVAAAVAAAAVFAVVVLVLVFRGRNGAPEAPDTPSVDGDAQKEPAEGEKGDAPLSDGKQEHVPPAGDAPVEEEPPEEPPAEDGPVNPLTGLSTEEDISKNRPWAVMINNLSRATPQAGIGAADVIVEAPVEGGITRFMALYQDLGDLQEIGPIRSSRPYYINMAMGFDAMYIHAGGSGDAYATLKSTGIDRIDGTNGSGETFHRDEWRRKNRGLEHSLMLDVPLVGGYAEKHDFRLTHGEDYTAPFAFDDGAERTGETANAVSVRFYGGSTKLTSFAYDPETKLYTPSQFDAVMTDASTGEAVKVRNIITVRTSISVIPGDDAGRLRATLSGSGEGQYIADGVAADIKWSRASETSQWVFTMEDGSPLTLGTGVTYIILLPQSGTVELG